MTTPPPPGMPEVPSNPDGPSDDEKTLGIITHVGMIFSVLVPLIIYLIKKDDSPWLRKEAAKAFNFGVLFNVGLIFIWIFNIIISIINLPGIIDLAISCIFCLVPLALIFVPIVLGVMNGVRVSNGEPSRYPFEAPILK